MNAERSKIDPKYLWRLEDIYESDAKWEEEFQAAKELAAAFPAYAGTLQQGADAIYAVLKGHSTLGLLLERLYTYAHMRRDEDNGDVFYQGLTDRAMQLITEAEAAGAFLVPELLSLPEGMLRDCAKEPRFSAYRFMLEDVERQRPHTLSAAEEKLLAMAQDPLGGPDNIFTMLSDVDMDFGTVTNEKGEKVKLTHGSYGMLLNSPDRRVRKDAFEGLYRAYGNVKNTVAATYAASVKGDVFRARARGFAGSLEATLFESNVPVAVYEQLIEAVHEALPALRKYLNLRKRVLKLDKLEMYDLYVPMLPDCDMPMDYEQAKAVVKEALEPLGPNYQALLDRAYTEHWIDVYETPGKTSGAFSWGAYGTHPYVLLNHQDNVDHALTLAHELGHAMHSYHSDEAQPFETAGYKTMVAEVASTVNEMLMTRYLLEHETDRDKRAYLVNQMLEQFRTTCFRQTMFAEFEWKAHQMAENGEPLTVESLSAMYRQLNELYYEDVVVDDNIAIEWMRIPHFYGAFYVYQYATGICTAVALSEAVRKGDLDRYITFLSSGGSDYPIELLKRAGVDLTKKESIRSALQVFSDYVDEMEALLS
jgi:oligoendopeptidase F